MLVWQTMRFVNGPKKSDTIIYKPTIPFALSLETSPFSDLKRIPEFFKTGLTTPKPHGFIFSMLSHMISYLPF